ncbi:MAG: hypothetical protein AAFV88_25340 [Planctomycetota bacterium]
MTTATSVLRLNLRWIRWQSPQWLVLLLGLSILLASAAETASAAEPPMRAITPLNDPPSDTPKSREGLPLPTDVTIPRTTEPDDPALREAIRSALKGDRLPVDQPMMEDVYEIIESRGSILEGTALDQNSLRDAPVVGPAQRHAAGGAKNEIQPPRFVPLADLQFKNPPSKGPPLMRRPMDGPVLNGPPSQPRAASKPQNPPERARERRKRLDLAESLLKTARRLENLEGGDQNRTLLVNQMVREAVRLLNEVAPPPQTNDRPTLLRPQDARPGTRFERDGRSLVPEDRSPERHSRRPAAMPNHDAPNVETFNRPATSPDANR